MFVLRKEANEENCYGKNVKMYLYLGTPKEGKRDHQKRKRKTFAVSVFVG